MRELCQSLSRGCGVRGGYIELLVEPRKPTFIGLRGRLSEARAAILGIPFDSGSTCRPGCRYAPARLREVSVDIETYDPVVDIDSAELPVADLGDVGSLLTPALMIERVSKVVQEVREAGARVVGVGGDHTVTLGLLSGLGASTSLVMFDAHMDYRDEYPPGVCISHATVLKRAREGLVREAVLVGVRAVSREEVRSAERDALTVIYSWSPKMVDELKEQLSTLSAPVYVSVDVDVLDPSVAPGVGCPEPAGLNFNQLLEAVELVVSAADVMGLDVVEVNPLVDVGDLTSYVAAKFLAKVLTLLAARGWR